MNSMIFIKSHAERETLAHWIVVIPILLTVAFVGIGQVNLFPPAPDEYYSMYNSGWIVNEPYSLLDVADSIRRNSPNQGLGYYFLLNLWGRLTTYDVALGRALGILCGLLSLSIVYRLGRDFVAPMAGLCGLIIVASNAFYNLYVPHVTHVLALTRCVRHRIMALLAHRFSTDHDQKPRLHCAGRFNLWLWLMSIRIVLCYWPHLEYTTFYL